MNEDMIEQVEFTCPQCGSHRFGTSYNGDINSDINNATGYCGGGHPCRFRWSRRDDAKYFRGTGKFVPRTHVAIGPLPR